MSPKKIEAILQAGAEKARAKATPLMRELRHAVGLRKLAQPAQTPSAKKQKLDKTGLPTFKQYREADGKFYFKLLGADGKLLLQSREFVTPKDAALAIASLQQHGYAAMDALHDKLQPIDNVSVAELTLALGYFIEAGT